jgi:hypothetical protein
MLNIIRNADVDVKIVWVGEKISLEIVVNGVYKHAFSPASNESRMCLNTEMETIRMLFNKGTYCFYNDILVDYRRADYRGFIHNDSSINELSERIGAKDMRTHGRESAAGLFNQYRGSKNNGVFLGGEWDKFDLSVKSLGIGGEFENKLIYKWSPFSSNITTSLEIQRLVCTNGLMAISPLVTYEVPLINDWQRNLHIISAQLQPRLNDTLNARFEEMNVLRASVYDVQRANQLLNERINTVDLSSDEQCSLNFLAEKTKVRSSLGRYYKDPVFEDKSRSKNAISDMTQFDIFNILTEASTHYGRDLENDSAIQRDLNRLVFDEIGRKKQLTPEIPLNQDSDHRRAFFGTNE